jgi:hypothetical protein
VLGVCGADLRIAAQQIYFVPLCLGGDQGCQIKSPRQSNQLHMGAVEQV